MTQLTLLLARHGETDLNTEERWQGRIDAPLNAAGMAQAQRLADELPPGIQAIVASPMQRARQTAEPAAARLGLPMAFDADFRERDFGVFDGTTLFADDFQDIQSEALFATVKSAATYFVVVSGFDDTAVGTYHLSVGVRPGAAQGRNCVTYTSTDVPKALADGGRATSVINVPGTPRIADLDVTLSIGHTRVPDLDVHLLSPAGSDIALFTDVGVNALDDLDIVIDDGLVIVAREPVGLDIGLAVLLRIRRGRVVRRDRFVVVRGKPMRLTVQGVGHRFRHHFDRPWGGAEPRRGHVVVIGETGLDRAAIEAAIQG